MPRVRSPRFPAQFPTGIAGKNRKAQPKPALTGSFESGRGGHQFALHSVNCPASSANYWRGESARGVSRNADLNPDYRLAARERQGRCDVPQLPEPMQKIRKGPARPSTLPLPAMHQDLPGAAR